MSGEDIVLAARAINKSSGMSISQDDESIIARRMDSQITNR